MRLKTAAGGVVLARIWRVLTDSTVAHDDDLELIEAAELAARELRAQIDHQLKPASEFDTKALGPLSSEWRPRSSRHG